MESNLVNLPESAVMCVLSRLHYQDLLSVGLTCRFLHGLVLSDYLWMGLCSPWKACVDLDSWRAGVDSAVALFRLLFSLSKLTGHWSACELHPFGGLLYVKWGHLSVVAYRIMVEWTGDLNVQHLFDVIGLSNGTTMTKIYTMCTTPTGPRGLSLSGALIWTSEEQQQFYLQLAEICDAEILNPEDPDPPTKLETSSHEIGHRGGLQLSLLMRRLGVSFGLSNRRAYAQDNCHISDAKCHILDDMSSKRIGGSMYARLIVEEARDELEFAGLWCGSYGPHGLEIINVKYSFEEIIATKVLGDPNVPCNEITFKAKIATASVGISSSLQEAVSDRVGAQDDEPFTIVKLYQGLGQIADTGYVHPQWIPGKLLVDSQNSIAFMWQDYGFLIPYQRLDLPSIIKEKGAMLK